MPGGSSGLLRALGRRLLVRHPGSLRNHVGDAVDDGVRDAQLLVNQLVRSFFVPSQPSRVGGKGETAKQKHQEQ